MPGPSKRSSPVHQVYTRQLFSKGHGNPLWCPEISAHPSTYVRWYYGMRIGDIGYETSFGAFEPLLNIRASADDPVNHLTGVPPNYEPLQIQEHEIKRLENFHHPGNPLNPCVIGSNVTSSQCIGAGIQVEDSLVPAGAGIQHQYTWNINEGAILHLSKGASRYYCSPARYVREYLAKNCEHLWSFATSRNDVGTGLWLVTSCDKSDTWSLGAFSKASADREIACSIGVMGIGGGNVSYNYSWENSSPCSTFRFNPGTPPHPSAEEDCMLDIDETIFKESNRQEPNNQCVFFKGFRITSRQSLLRKGKQKLKVSSPDELDGFRYISPSTSSSSSSSNAISPASSLFSRSSHGSDSASKDIDMDVDTVSDIELSFKALVEDCKFEPECHYPLDELNRYLLFKIKSSGDFAITHHDDWETILKILREKGQSSAEAALQESITTVDAVVTIDAGLLNNWVLNVADSKNFDCESVPSSQMPSRTSSQTSLTSSPKLQQLPISFQAPQDAKIPGQGGSSRKEWPKTAEDEIDGEPSPQEPTEGGKLRPAGSCARCKILKVKCEFRTETDPCKRCLNAGQECYIPGRKKRRTPPKREHLLNEIRDQAAQISALMARLKEVEESTKVQAPSTSTFDTFILSDTSSTLYSPVLSPRAITPPTSRPGNNASTSRKTVEDWVSKLYESLAEFHGLIGFEDATMPQGNLAEDDSDNSSVKDDGDFDDVEIEGSAMRIDLAIMDNDSDFTAINLDGVESAQKVGDQQKRTKSRTASDSSAQKRAVRKGKDSGGSSNTDKPATLPSEKVPFGLVSNLSIGNSRQEPSDTLETATEGKQVDANFFSLDPMRSTGGFNWPHILTRGIVTTKEAEKLFNIYFEKMNLSSSLLDPVLYTAQKTCIRSPFLFTVICAIASRYYTERPDIYPQAMHYAQLAAGTALISGHRSVEECHAYILLSLYPVPARRWDDENGWLYLGLAIRIAIGLKLHLPATLNHQNESDARDILNRTRCWLNCFNLDRSMGSQYGLAPLIPNTNYMANHSGDWWQSSEYSMDHFDMHISCHSAELGILAEFRTKVYSNPDHPTGLNKEVDMEKLAVETDDELQQLKAHWMEKFDMTDQSNLQNVFRTGLLKLHFSYARLAVLSFSFQHTFDKNNADKKLFLERCLSAATDICKGLLLDIGRPEFRVYLRHGPEAQSVSIAFAAAFLIKLLQPMFAAYLSIEKRLEIRRIVKDVVEVLGSPEVAIDDRHGPKLYSRYLEGLLATSMARVEIPQQMTAESLQRPGSDTLHRSQSPAVQPSERSANVHSTPSSASTMGVPSPLPNQAAHSFEQSADNGTLTPFTPMRGGQPVDERASTCVGGSALGLTMHEIFNPPLPSDKEILSSMHSFSDWGQVPSFSWMPTSSNSSNSVMKALGLDT